MKFFSRNSSAACSVLVLFCLCGNPAEGRVSPFAAPPPSYLLLVNGQTYRERNANTRRPVASLTKIMTALIVLETCNLDEVVVVSQGAARETGSRIGLRRGDRLRVRDLLAATLMASANDAFRALADHACGNQKAFVVKMNERARDLNLENTRFSNACGHDSSRLYSTAHDLALLAEKAMQKPFFARLVAKRGMKISTVKGSRTFHLRNKNRLIGSYPGALGVKTGTTPNAGQCLVALAEREDRKVLLVFMHARNRWRIAPAMLDAAFAADSTAIGNAKGMKASRESR